MFTQSEVTEAGIQNIHPASCNCILGEHCTLKIGNTFTLGARCRVVLYVSCRDI